MNISGTSYRTIWLNPDGRTVTVIDQTKLPHVFETLVMRTSDDAAHVIRSMVVRGAPLIGATAAFGVALAMNEDTSDAHLAAACAKLGATRPTAVNLRWALERLTNALMPLPAPRRAEAAYALAVEVAEEDVRLNMAIGEAGAKIIADKWIAGGRKKPVQVLTHCNAGWLATVDWGTAMAPVYRAHNDGVPVHVFVDETRPRNQGASLTAWELKGHGVPFTLIVDNAGGHLMQHGEVDLCIVGADRVTADGSVCNKIGTYLKALAAHDNNVPFYAAVPSPTIDWDMASGNLVPIEDRGSREVTHITGRSATGDLVEVQLSPGDVATRNPGFDVTPPHYVTGLITERGVVDANRSALASAFR